MIDLIYIASSSFSGSTLLTFLLSAHQRIATVGELKASPAMGDVEEYRCSCGARIRECPFWKRLGDELRTRGVDFDLARFGTHFRFHEACRLADRVVNAQLRGPLFETARGLALRLLPGAPGEFHRILERNRVIIEALCDMRGAPTFVDSSKDPVRLKYMAESRLWRVRVVHLVRDGRGAIDSHMKHYRWSVEEAALEWRRTNEACERVRAKVDPGSWVRLRYEDLCRDPYVALESILAMIGGRVADIPEDFRSMDHHIMGNNMRLRAKGQIELDETWRQRLGPAALAAFDRIAGEMNRCYGYL